MKVPTSPHPHESLLLSFLLFLSLLVWSTYLTMVGICCWERSPRVWPSSYTGAIGGSSLSSLCLECALCLLSLLPKAAPKTHPWDRNLGLRWLHSGLSAWLNPVKTPCVRDWHHLRPIYKLLRCGQWMWKTIYVLQQHMISLTNSFAY